MQLAEPPRVLISHQQREDATKGTLSMLLGEDGESHLKGSKHTPACIWVLYVEKAQVSIPKLGHTVYLAIQEHDNLLPHQLT